MRRFYFPLFILITFCGCEQAVKTQTPQTIVKDTTPVVKVEEKKATLPESAVLNKLIETVVDDLNNDGMVDTIKLFQDTADKQDNWFNKVTLNISGQKRQIFKTEDAWSDIDTAFKKQNQAQSSRAFIYKDSKQPILLFFGMIYGDGRARSSVIEIKDHETKMVFDEEWDWIIDLSDLNNDGIAEIIVKTSSEGYHYSNYPDGTIWTYDPYYIYSLDSTKKVELELMQAYNTKNYVWAGLKSPEKVIVFSPKNGGRYRIVK